jgi:hypothetical protein
MVMVPIFSPKPLSLIRLTSAVTCWAPAALITASETVVEATITSANLVIGSPRVDVTGNGTVAGLVPLQGERRCPGRGSRAMLAS